MAPLAATQYGLTAALASALLHALWQGALLAIAAALVLRAMDRASAAARHNVAMAFLVATAALPALQALGLWQGPDATGDGLLPALTAPRTGGAVDSLVQQSSPVAAAVVLAWLAGVVLMAARHLAGLRALAAMERAAHAALPPALVQRLEELRAALRIRRPVLVRLSDRAPGPCTARLLRPIVWLPLSLVTRTPADQLEALLAHELAHIARRDWLWNGVQCVIESLLFFHPAVWWLGRRIRQEREHACDDLAVAACGDPVALAEALAGLEQARQPLRLALAAQGGSLLQRVSRLLSGPPSRGRWGPLAVLGALAVAGALLVTQIALAGGQLPDLQVTASTAGELRPGDFRQIVANGIDGQRFYRASLDAQGRLTEIYRKDGQARPIDAGVRRWLAEVSSLSLLSPHAPQAAGFAGPPDALMALIARHPAVLARFGAPAAWTGRPLNGNVRLHDRGRGEADFRIELVGPGGIATAAVKAEQIGGAWTIRRLSLR